MRLILLGPPGAGKGTPSHSSCGTTRHSPVVYRGYAEKLPVAAKTPIGLQAKEINGTRAIWCLMSCRRHCIDKGLIGGLCKGFILEWIFPRTVAQA